MRSVQRSVCKAREENSTMGGLWAAGLTKPYQVTPRAGILGSLGEPPQRHFAEERSRLSTAIRSTTRSATPFTKSQPRDGLGERPSSVAALFPSLGLRLPPGGGR